MTPTNLYDARVAAGSITPDAAQRQVLPSLDHLQHELQQRSRPRGFLRRLFTSNSAQAPRGLYLFGEVGRGKTMLMNLLFETLAGTPRHRFHFHAFMQQVHALRTKHAGETDIIGKIADEITDASSLLCLDEMQVADIADAMIMGRLFDALISRKVCVVTTSNVPPEQLYKDGLNRQLFLPFIATLHEHLDIVALPSATDYRLDRMRARETYLCPATTANRVAFNAIWNDLTDSDQGRPATIEVLDRNLIVPKAAHSCAAFTFNELCKDALGPPDYLAIAAAFRTVFVSGITKLDPSQRNEAKRFILMIDTFYDAKTRLVALADCAQDEIAPKGQHGFEFQRTVSRLKEMHSDSWWA